MRFARALSGYSLLACVYLASACEELDPVYTVDLCKNDGEISKNCQQCLTPPLDPRCPQCRELGTNPDCDQGSAVTAAGAAGRTNQSGSGGIAAANGGGAGAAATSPCSHACVAPTPACLSKDGPCVECVSNSDCPAPKVCNPIDHTCVPCYGNFGCTQGYCEMTAHMCVDCLSDTQCNDKVNNVCSSSHKCVDCDAQHGCSDAAKPACFSDACVACVNDTHCRDPNRKCLSQTHTCVECVAAIDCSAARPACGPGNTCVECVRDADCGSRYCLTGPKKCVACLEDAHCKTAAKARCVTGNVCDGCTENSQCAHLPETPACDLQSGECVPCVDDGTCGDKSCVRAEHKCSDVKRGSLAACAVCDADSECATGLNCVPLAFGSAAASKSYCLYAGTTLNPCASSMGALNRPFSRMLSDIETIDGTMGSFCAPQTTCEALLDATKPVGGKTCDNADACGIAGLDDGVCNSSGRCTFVCTADVDCPPEGLRMCTGTGAQKFCAQTMP